MENNENTNPEFSLGKFSFSDDNILTSTDNSKPTTSRKTTATTTIVNPENNKVYIIGKVCGVGSFCKVYKCLEVPETPQQTQIAIKTLKKKYIKHEKYIQHTIQEQDGIVKLNNDYIIKLITSFQSNGRLYLVYPFYSLDGFSLLLFSNKHLPEAIIKRILYQTIKCLQYGHSEKIIYRDLKLENIGVDVDHGAIKGIDFGLSVLLKDKEEKVKEICGTIDYGSPELCNGDEYGYDVDYWALGVLGYVGIEGHFPFKGKERGDVLNSINNSEGMFNRKDISLDITTFIKNLLRRNVIERRDIAKNLGKEGIFEEGKEGTTDSKILRDFARGFDGCTCNIIDNGYSEGK